MTAQTATARKPRWLSKPVVRFIRHYIEMAVAMGVGMLTLGPVWSWLWPGYDQNTTVNALVMATNMTVGMVAVMVWRKHSTPAIVEMSAAMYLPFVVMLVPYWFGAVSSHAVMMAGHGFMFATMLAAMLLRRQEYLGHHH